MGLRDDRRGRDREIDAVAFVEAVLRGVDTGDIARVDQHVLRTGRQRLDRAAHREQARVVDIYGVDLVDLGDADADAGRDRADPRLRSRALLEVEALGVVDAR